MTALEGQSREELYRNWHAWVVTNLGRDADRAVGAANAATDAAANGSGFNAAADAARDAWKTATSSSEVRRSGSSVDHGELGSTISVALGYCGILALIIGLGLSWEVWGSAGGIFWLVFFDATLIEDFVSHVDSAGTIGGILLVLAPCLSIAGWVAWRLRTAVAAAESVIDPAAARGSIPAWMANGSTVGKVGLVLWAAPLLLGLPLSILAWLFFRNLYV